MRQATINIPDNYKEYMECNEESKAFVNEARLCFLFQEAIKDGRGKDFLINSNNLVSTIQVRYKLIGHWMDVNEPSYRDSSKMGFRPYHCIPLHLDPFLLSMIKAKELLKKKKLIKFIDAGCGIGDKVKIAHHFFEVNASGVEFNEFTFKSAVQLNQGLKFHLGDITKFDFGDYDIIYAYNPIQDDDGMSKFFENVVRTAKIGTICIFYNVESGFRAMHKYENNFKKVANNLYKLKEK